MEREKYLTGREDILAKMPKLKEHYGKNALATTCVDSLNHNGNPYDLIEQLILMNIESGKRIEQMVRESFNG